MSGLRVQGLFSILSSNKDSIFFSVISSNRSYKELELRSRRYKAGKSTEISSESPNKKIWLLLRISSLKSFSTGSPVKVSSLLSSILRDSRPGTLDKNWTEAIEFFLKFKTFRELGKSIGRISRMWLWLK